MREVMLSAAAMEIQIPPVVDRGYRVTELRVDFGEYCEQILQMMIIWTLRYREIRCWSKFYSQFLEICHLHAFFSQ
jgi:hypothetical protein